MTKKYTFEEILSINKGNKEDAHKIISIYLASGKLIRISNKQFDGYLSQTIEKDDLRLRSSLDRFSETSSKISNIWNLVAIISGWVAFIITQLLRINVFDILHDWVIHE